MSHPDKKGKPTFDLSSDSEAIVENESLAPKELAVERIITKVFSKLHSDVIVTDRLRSLFVSKLSRMGKSIQSVGGRQRSLLLEKWRGTNWSIELTNGEIVPLANKKGKKDSVINFSSKSKILQLRKDLKQTSKRLCDVTNKCEQLKKSNKELLAQSKPLRKRKCVKSWSEYCVKYKRRKIKRFADAVSGAIKDEDFTYEYVQLRHTDTGETVAFENKGGIPMISVKEASQEDKNCLIRQNLYIKEKYNISNVAYHEISMTNPDVPNAYSLRKAAKQMDLNSTIQDTPGKAIGVQQSLKVKLTKRLEYLVSCDATFQQQKVQVKVTGDGTIVSRSMHVLVIAFTLVNVKSKECPNSPRGNHVVALINTTEDYNNLQEAVRDIEEEIKNTTSITVNDLTFEIEYFLGGDWKFLAISAGLKAANSCYPCVWCKCPNTDRHDLSKTWSIFDGAKGARTIAEIQELSKSAHKKGVETYGCIRQPLFPSIAVDHIVPDILHLFLRISDVLINLLILELRRQDGLKKKSKSSSTMPQVTVYEQFLNDECKVSFHFYPDKVTKETKWRDLTGPEKVKLFSKISIPTLFPNVPQAAEVQKLWTDFFSIYQTLRSTEKIPHVSFQTRATNWVKLFKGVYQSKHITPYIHLFVNHISEFLSVHGTIAAFSQQGLEKLNDDVTKYYFRSTNHRDKECLKQIILKLNRLEELEDNCYGRKKLSHVCRICKQVGHNAKTCKQNAQ